MREDCGFVLSVFVVVVVVAAALRLRFFLLGWSDISTTGERAWEAWVRARSIQIQSPRAQQICRLWSRDNFHVYNPLGSQRKEGQIGWGRQCHVEVMWT